MANQIIRQTHNVLATTALMFAVLPTLLYLAIVVLLGGVLAYILPSMGILGFLAVVIAQWIVIGATALLAAYQLVSFTLAAIAASRLLRRLGPAGGTKRILASILASALVLKQANSRR